MFVVTRQLRTVAHSLTASAATTLVHAFITVQLDYYCSTSYTCTCTGLPACQLSCLDRVLPPAAALLVKYRNMIMAPVTRRLLDVLYWLPVRRRIEYRVVSLVWRCQLGLAPAYLIDLCQPVSAARGADPFALLRGEF